MTVGQLEMDFETPRSRVVYPDHDALWAAVGAFLGGLAAGLGLILSAFVAVVALGGVLVVKRFPKRAAAARHAPHGLQRTEIVEVVEVLTEMDEQVRDLRRRLDLLERAADPRSRQGKMSA
jgi:hypothetical protein